MSGMDLEKEIKDIGELLRHLRRDMGVMNQRITKLEELDPGEKELRKGFEEVTTRNVNAILDYGKVTRQISKEAKDDVNRVREQVAQQDQKLADINQALAVVRGKLYSGGTS